MDVIIIINQFYQNLDKIHYHYNLVKTKTIK